MPSGLSHPGGFRITLADERRAGKSLRMPSCGGLDAGAPAPSCRSAGPVSFRGGEAGAAAQAGLGLGLGAVPRVGAPGATIRGGAPWVFSLGGRSLKSFSNPAESTVSSAISLSARASRRSSASARMSSGAPSSNHPLHRQMPAEDTREHDPPKVKLQKWFGKRAVVPGGSSQRGVRSGPTGAPPPSAHPRAGC